MPPLAALEELAELAAVAEHQQLSVALSKAAIVAVAVLSERELASARSGALSDIKTLARIVTDAVREEYPSPPVAAPPSN